MISETTIIKKLDKDIIRQLKDELLYIENANLWDNHLDIKSWGKDNVKYINLYSIYGPLRHGKTCWLRLIENDMKIMLDRTNDFPVTIGLMNELSDNSLLGKAYWHRLRPGEVIDKHSDGHVPYIKKLKHRYHIYLNIPDKSKIILDDRLITCSNYENSIVDFNANLPHAYSNESQEDLIFFVGDIFDKNAISV